MNDNFKVSFFIVGAPRSGTTNLHYMLSRHPEVSLPSNKEPKYFAFKAPIKKYFGKGDDRRVEQVVTDFSDYKALFQDRDIKGEVSPIYLASDCAKENIRSHNDNAKIVIILRDPVQRAYSHYMQFVKSGDETLGFENSLKEGGRRVLNGWFPDWDYVRFSTYCNDVSEYFEKFGRENVKVFIYEEFKDDFLPVYCELIEFIGAAPFQARSQKSINSSGQARSELVERFFNKAKLFRRSIRKVLGERCYQQGLQYWHRLRTINTKKVEGLSAQECAKIREIYFKKDIEKLEKLLGRELFVWR